MIERIKKFIIKWNDIITVTLGLFLVFWAEKIVTTFYPTSVRYDVGFHYDVIYSIAAWLILHGVSYFIFKINWARMERYVDFDMDAVWDSLYPYQKIRISIGLFLAYFYSAILTFLAVSLS